MKFIIPTELDVKMSTNRFPITFIDFGVIILAFLISFGLRVVVYPPLQIPFIIFVLITTTILVLDSPDNKGKKVYDSIILTFKKEKSTFSRIENYEED
ncbi:DUF5592 family protein [Clostridium sp. DSM 100503]|uniref:DUF5592 family protein n=1 Tax=Clostridium sp. DSM 100503 TaxID=2963282 RepID=UPI00214A55F7|nr:DUF5592 family protein [Clostridium sp. DSM 100503]MCR1950428.1 DUF5592 family protein [Clostridium sp. DSM 100503]